MNATIERVRTRALTVPTEQKPESDGTLAWSATTMVLVECSAGGVTGLGYSYAHAAAAQLIESVLAPCVSGLAAAATGEAHARMVRAVRNQGREGLAAMAISAVDVSLWDLKARLLGLPLHELLGAARRGVPVYASGGFTSQSLDELSEELGAYARAGFSRVKIKVGREPRRDPERVRAARAALGSEIELMVDGNGAYERKEALTMAHRLAEYEVVWFEEPVSSDDLAGLCLLRARAPVKQRIAAGEYGYDTTYFRRMLNAEAVDVLQADATRCLGITGFLRVGALAAAFAVPLSSHCAPTLHCHVAAAAENFAHLEYFRDHARIEHLLFEGAPVPSNGELVPPRSPGLGITLREQEIGRYVA